VASADLGGLGSKDGPPVAYNWTVPSLMPLALPWLGVLLLLALNPNRSARAWWIWLPLGGVVVLANLVQPAFDFLPEELLDIFVQVVSALAFGLAAVWLLAPYLARSHRVLTFLCLAPALAGFSVLSVLAAQDWGAADVTTLIPALVLLALSILVVSVAMALAGLVCRRRYRPAGLCLWLLVWLLGIGFVLTAPFFLFAMIASGGEVAWLEFFQGVLAFVFVNFAIALPFLILSSANSFYRERLKALLHLERPVAPPVMAPAPMTAAHSTA
jgi:hypothetical protein